MGSVACQTRASNCPDLSRSTQWMYSDPLELVRRSLELIKKTCSSTNSPGVKSLINRRGFFVTGMFMCLLRFVLNNLVTASKCNGQSACCQRLQIKAKVMIDEHAIGKRNGYRL